METTKTTRATELAEPMLEVIRRLSAVADWIESLDLADLADCKRPEVMAVEEAVRDAAHAATVRARWCLKAGDRHLADAISPLFIALAGTGCVLDELLADDDALGAWLR